MGYTLSLLHSPHTWATKHCIFDIFQETLIPLSPILARQPLIRTTIHILPIIA